MFVEELLNVLFLLGVVIPEPFQGCHPALLDELVVAGELPDDVFVGVFGGEVVLLQGHGFADVLAFEHIFFVKLDGEVRGIAFIALDLLDVDNLDGAFGELADYLYFE